MDNTVIEELAYHNYLVLKNLGVCIANQEPNLREQDMFQGCHVRQYTLTDNKKPYEVNSKPVDRKKVMLVPLHHSTRTVADAGDPSHSPRVKFYIRHAILKKSTVDTLLNTKDSSWEYHLANPKVDKQSYVTLVSEKVVCDLYDVYDALCGSQCPYKLTLQSDGEIPVLILTPIHIVDNTTLQKDIENDVNLSYEEKDQLVSAGLEEFEPK